MGSPARHKGGVLKVEQPPPAPSEAIAGAESVAVALTGAVLAVRAGEPVVAVVPAERSGDESLPCGNFLPSEHQTLEAGVRSWVGAQTGVELGLVEQLCTFGSRMSGDADLPHIVFVSYFALVEPRQCNDRTRATWRSWYSFFPWEDWRNGRPPCLDEIERRLEAWADGEILPGTAHRLPNRRHRMCIAFGGGRTSWDEEKVAERYELLADAGIVGGATEEAGIGQHLPRLVHPMLGDHSPVLARAIGMLRRAIKHRPLVFELMHEEFTLFELQRVVEAILGPHLHKQNFRRMVEGCGLVEPTGGLRLRTGGRPAQLYRFRRNVVYERVSPGVRLRPGRA
jgi:hypothetical protein